MSFYIISFKLHDIILLIDSFDVNFYDTVFIYNFNDININRSAIVLPDSFIENLLNAIICFCSWNLCMFFFFFFIWTGWISDGIQGVIRPHPKYVREHLLQSVNVVETCLLSDSWHSLSFVKIAAFHAWIIMRAGWSRPFLDHINLSKKKSSV